MPGTQKKSPRFSWHFLNLVFSCRSREKIILENSRDFQSLVNLPYLIFEFKYWLDNPTVKWVHGENSAILLTWDSDLLRMVSGCTRRVGF